MSAYSKPVDSLIFETSIVDWPDKEIALLIGAIADQRGATVKQSDEIEKQVLDLLAAIPNPEEKCK